MKPTFLRFALVLGGLLLFQTAYTQIKVGIRGGIILANLDVDPTDTDDPDYKSITGFQIAVPVEIGLGSMFAIQPEIMYGMHGTRIDESFNDTEGGLTTVGFEKVDLRINTLEIPLLAKVKFGSDEFKFHLLAGPSFGFGLSGKSKGEYSFKTTAADGTVIFDESGNETSKAVFLKDNYKADELNNSDDFPVSKTNLNLHLGAGLNVHVGQMTIFLDGRYMLGLSDLIPDEEGTVEADRVTVKSRRIGISAGLLFPL